MRILLSLLLLFGCPSKEEDPLPDASDAMTPKDASPDAAMDAEVSDAQPADAEIDAGEGTPSAIYTPTSLDFGTVIAGVPATRTITVASNGSAPLLISSVEVISQSPPGTWTAVLDPVLTTGLAAGAEAQIRVTFVPAEDAASGTLAITDNTTAGSIDILLSGRSSGAPVASVDCPAPGACNDPGAMLRECNGISFGAVTAGDPACDIVVEIVNSLRNGQPVADLAIERIEVTVQDYCCGAPGPIFDGADVGFSVRDTGGNPLAPDSANPLLVPIAPGSTEGRSRLIVSFDGSRTGLWRGAVAEMTGLRLFTNDPDAPLITVPVTAQGSAPQLVCSPASINFGSVAQGMTASETIQCRNAGDALLTIANIGVGANPEFFVSTDQGSTSNIMLDIFESLMVTVDYTPADGGADSEALIIDSDDPLQPQLQIPVRGGALPEIAVDPSDIVLFSGAQPVSETITISNLGMADLEIARLEICGPSAVCDSTHPSVGDFAIDACGGATECNLNQIVSLTPFDLILTYDNDDLSTTDLAELRIHSNDPGDPVHLVVLDGQP